MLICTHSVSDEAVACMKLPGFHMTSQPATLPGNLRKDGDCRGGLHDETHLPGCLEFQLSRAAVGSLPCLLLPLLLFASRATHLAFELKPIGAFVEEV